MMLWKNGDCSIVIEVIHYGHFVNLLVMDMWQVKPAEGRPVFVRYEHTLDQPGLNATIIRHE